MYSTNNTVDIKNSFFLTGRNIGASRKLRGDVATITCFVRNCADDFSETTKKHSPGLTHLVSLGYNS